MRLTGTTDLAPLEGNGMSQAHENLLRKEASARAELISEVRYDVHLDLRGDDLHFGSKVVVHFDSESGAETFIDCTAHQVHSVVLNGRELSPDAVTATRIWLDDLQAHNELVVVSAMSYTREGRGLHHFRDPSDGRAYLHTQFEPFDAHLVFACFDQPDLKASYQLHVDAPADWVVISNMAAESQPTTGEPGIWSFLPTPLLSTYLVAVVAGGYACVTDKHGDIDLAIYCRASLREHLDPEEIFELTRQGLDWFAAAFDFPYPFGKYDQLFVPEFAMGAMEHPGCVTFVESYVFRSKVTESARELRAETILHEMAHMWFGDLVTMKWWDDLWLNESFATFMSVLALFEATRFKNSWVTFLDSEKEWARYQDQLPTTHPIAADAPDVETANQNFDGITYAKGASVLRQLVAWVGQDAFLEGCRGYFRAHAWGNATLTDFLAQLEKSSGRDLDAWRDEWLMTTGVNTLMATRGSGELTGPIQISQRTADGDPAPRRHHLRVGLYGRTDQGLVLQASTEVDLLSEHTVIEDLAEQPRPDLLVINDGDLTYAKVVLDKDTLVTLSTGLREVQDPLTRALLWGATWDMVRDAELPARVFARQVMVNADSETDIGVLQRLLGRAVVALDRYGSADHLEAGMLELEQNAQRAVLASVPGSDHQLAWLRHWAVVARSVPGGAEMLAILEGDLQIEELSLDTDLRWHLVGSLAASGVIDADRIDQELRRDPTDLGTRAAAAARAMLPDPEHKRSAWEQLVASDGLSHTMARELYKGFRLLRQPKILAPFAALYFEVLPAISDTRGMDVAVEFVEATFPHSSPTREMADQVDAAIRTDLPGPIKRALLEQRDVLERTLKARDLDASA